jgi:hypothetical protein
MEWSRVAISRPYYYRHGNERRAMEREKKKLISRLLKRVMRTKNGKD